MNLRNFPVGLPSLQVDQLLRDFRPDVVHAASPFLLGWNALSAAKRRGIPTVAIFQTDVAGYTERNRLGVMREVTWLLLRSIHSAADLTLAPSSSSMRDLTRNRFERVRHWGRGVDLESYHPNHRQLAESAELRAAIAAPDEVVVGYVGRLAPEKQVERLAELRGMKNTRVAIVGEGPSEASIRATLAGMPVTYLGRRSGHELSLAYSVFDLFVHTGTEETFGQTLQEAHAAGLPVVAPLAGGPIDLVTHGSDGYLFDPALRRGGDSMRDYVTRLLADPQLRSRLGEAGRRRVLGRSWEGVCDELLNYYSAVINASAEAEGLMKTR